jgi:hypothetical protein
MEPQKYRTYELHPFIADYADEAALHTAFATALTRINAGELLDIAPPEYDVQPPKKAGAPALQRVS